MHVQENLTILRNILYKCFFIGLLMLIAAGLIYLPCKCAVSNFYTQTFGVSLQAYNNLWVGFIGIIKTILIFIFLVPALAVHSTEFGLKKKLKKEDEEKAAEE